MNSRELNAAVQLSAEIYTMQERLGIKCKPFLVGYAANHKPLSDQYFFFYDDKNSKCMDNTGKDKLLIIAYQN